MKHLLLFFVLELVSFYIQAGESRTIMVNGIERKYIIYKPKLFRDDRQYPVVLDFHGGGGTASSTEKNFGFNNIADAKNFIVVYPEGINKGWNDGRKEGKLRHTSDDLAFISLLIDKLIKEDNADASRIYVTGISNGAFFSIYLASKLNNKIKAVAAICGNITEEFKDSFALSKPLSLLLINGTADPLVKYNGGAIFSERAARGASTSTDFTISKWLQEDKINDTAGVENIPDLDKKDGCTATKYIYNSKLNGITVILIKVENGGHTWPGGKQYLPKLFIGKVCRDFNASEVIWNFFQNH